MDNPDDKSASVQLSRMVRPDAERIHDAIRLQGERELTRRTSALWWSGLAAGFSMSLSLIAEGLIRAALPETPWRPLVSSLGYTLGFIVVVLGRQQLFTENTLTVILPLLERPGWLRLAIVARLWGIVLAANLVGTAAVAYLCAGTAIFSPEAREAFRQIGVEALRPGFVDQMLKALAAGWIIALMVWLMPALGSARILAVGALTYFIALGELAHVIAGSAEAAYAVADGAASWPAYFADYVAPAFLGNVAGGVVGVALLNHLQVRGSGERPQG